MVELGGIVVIGIIAIFAGIVGGVIGFGSSIILMPILVWVFGPKLAVPIMAVAALFANGSRVLTWWKEISWPAVGWYALTGIPAAALGARTFVALSPALIEAALGCLLIAMIPGRKYLARREWRLQAWHLIFPGALIGYLSGLMVSTGPINTPFFLAHGLTKGAFIGTEALGSFLVFGSKASVLSIFSALPVAAVTKGVMVGIALSLGSVIAKRFVQSLKIQQFERLMDAVLLLAGITMLLAIFNISQ